MSTKHVRIKHLFEKEHAKASFKNFKRQKAYFGNAKFSKEGPVNNENGIFRVEKLHYN